MDKNIVSLQEYKNSLPYFHIHKVSGICKAQQNHMHDYFQIYFVLKGVLLHRTQYGEDTLSYGNAFIIPPRFEHGISYKTSWCEFYSCSFTKSFILQIMERQPLCAEFIKKIMEGGEENVLRKVFLNAKEQIHIRNVLELMIDEYEEREYNFSEVIQNGLLCVISIMAKAYKRSENNDSDTLNPIGDSIEYIAEHYMDNLNIEKIAKKVYLRRNTFCKLFREATTFTFNEYLNKVRIEKALELIQQNELSLRLEEIAIKIGYTNYVTFYRNFIEVVGMTPKKYLESL